MPVVLDGDVGERVLIYGSDGSALRSILTTTAGLLRQTRHFTQVVSQAYAATPGNHAETIRWTYTVPAGRIAFLEGVHMHSSELAAAATTQLKVRLIRSGGTADDLAIIRGTTVNWREFNGAYDLALAAGDAVDATSSNNDGAARELVVNAFFREITL